MMNMAKVSNYGVELTLGAYIFRDTPVKWSVDLNLSSIRDEIKDLVGRRSDYFRHEENLVERI